MATKNTPKRKHLTVIEKGEKTYFRVQINKEKLGLKVNKTFTDYEQAIAFLDACENKLGSKHVKTLIDIESREYKLIGEYMKSPPLNLYPDLSNEDQEAIRQHAIAAMNVTQQAKLEIAKATANGDDEQQGSTALLDGVRKFVNVRDLDIELVDAINPFQAAYAVLSKSMDEKLLRQVQAAIEAKKANITEEEARDLAKRALEFKKERGRLPDVQSADAWERRLAEGVAALTRYVAQAKATEAKKNNG